MQAIFALCNQTLIAIGLYTPLFKPALSRTFLSAKLSPLAQKLNCFYGRGIATNVLALGAVADFGALNCQYTTKVDARKNVQLTTSPAIEPNACCKLAFCPPSLSSRCISVLLLSFYLLRFCLSGLCVGCFKNFRVKGF